MCGNQLLNSSPVICCCSVPSGCIFQICMCPVRVELKKIHWPSGVDSGPSSTPLAVVSRISSPPSAGIL